MALGFGFDLMSQATRQRPWTPRYLFGDGEQGAWYDPSDFSTLYQDSAGTTPVTQLGQPVGLMLDKSQGAKPTGPELVTNGDFSQWSSDNPVDWTVVAAETAGSFVTQSGNAARIVSDGSYMGISQSGFTAGKVYRVEFDVLAVDTGFLVAMGGGSTVAIDSTGHKAFLLAAGASNFGFYRDFSVGAVDFTVTNVSVREIPGNHASQSTSTARPTVQARVNLLERTEEFDQSPWVNATGGTSTGPTLTADYADGPFADTRAYRFQATCGATSSDLSLISQTPNVTSGTVVISLYVRSNTGSDQELYFRSNTADNTTITATSSWQRFEFTASSNYRYQFGVRGSYSDQTADVLIYGAQAEIGTSATTYQRVTTATDYEDIGLPRYLEFDGVDDTLDVANKGLTANKTQFVALYGSQYTTTPTGFATAFAATTNSASNARFFSGDAALDNTKWGIGGRRLDGDSFAELSGGAVDLDAHVHVGERNWGDGTATRRVDGVDVVTGTLGTAGATTFTSSAAQSISGYSGTYFYPGRIYQMILRDSVISGALLDATERYVANRTGVTL